jgi:uncharacterized Fe-S radical SAM superfamily protein PflX
MLTDPSCAHPAYLRLGHDALASRAHRAVATLSDCRACPRDCGVNRLEDRWATEPNAIVLTKRPAKVFAAKAA